MDVGKSNAAASELAGELRHAFVAGELTAYYQPEYDLASGRIVALEALCRWHHPVRGLLLPERFIDVAEHYGLIADVGRFMLEESGRQAAEWIRRGVDVGVSINVSPTELNPAFARGVLDRLAAFKLPRRALTVEITESPAISHSADELGALETLIAAGVGVSIDDFGSGETSLELVERLPITEVKIDKSLVHDPSDRTDELARACVRVARERAAIVVAEGIETPEHFERARQWGADRAQGYFFAPPLPIDEVEPLLVGVS